MSPKPLYGDGRVNFDKVLAYMDPKDIDNMYDIDSIEFDDSGVNHDQQGTWPLPYYFFSLLTSMTCTQIDLVY